MTIKLYHTDSYQTEFEATIIKKMVVEGKSKLWLDKSCFYPDAGGQICDTGTIGGYPVFSIQEEDGNIVHYINGDIPLRQGDKVIGEIDWNNRFDHMQQHTGQHILSAVIRDLWKKETSSFHMGEEMCTIDIANTEFDEEKLRNLEISANNIMTKNSPIYQYYLEDDSDYITEKNAKILKTNERLRIVEIEELEKNYCGGTHCKNTGEVGLIKLIGWENRGDKTRISFICGNRAQADYQKKHLITKRLSNFFTIGIDHLEDKVVKLSKENKELNKKYNILEKKLIIYEAEELKQNIITDKNNLSIISKIYLEKNIQQLRQTALILIKEIDCLVIVGANNPEPVLCLACPQESDINLVELMNEIIKEHGGKGGGTSSLAMCRFDKHKELEIAFKKITEKISGGNI